MLSGHILGVLFWHQCSEIKVIQFRSNVVFYQKNLHARTCVWHLLLHQIITALLGIQSHHPQQCKMSLKTKKERNVEAGETFLIIYLERIYYFKRHNFLMYNIIVTNLKKIKEVINPKQREGQSIQSLVCHWNNGIIRGQPISHLITFWWSSV